MLSGKFDVQIREEHGYAVIQTEGYLNGPRGENLAEAAKDLMQKGYTKFVINLAETKLINSIGISILIEIIELLEEARGNPKLLWLDTDNRAHFQAGGAGKARRNLPGRRFGNC